MMRPWGVWVGCGLAAAVLFRPATAAGPQPPCALGGGECQLPDQQGHGEDMAVGAVSDLSPNAGFSAADNFTAAGTGSVTTVCWWGMYLELAPPPGDCGPGGVPDVFTVTYFTNEPGFPGTPDQIKAGPFPVTPAKAATGNLVTSIFGDLAEYEYSATHAPVPVTAGECVWVRITNDTTGSDPSCIWLWSTAPAASEGGLGDAVSWQGQFVNDFDLAFCVNQVLGDPSSCALSIDPGCQGATNQCETETSPDPGCDDPVCCTKVCDELPFCCIVEWDDQCVNIAGELCSLCGELGTGDCFAADFEPYCDDSCGGAPCIGCCQIVCAADPACCEAEFGWDGFCAFEALQLCQCDSGTEPPNDDCVDAISINLGDTAIDNDCATPSGPSHATCTDGFLNGLGLDIWYSYLADFTGQLLVSTCGQVDFDTQLAVYEGCDCGALSDPPLACNNDGPVCPAGSSSLITNVTSGTCYLIRVGSSFVHPAGTGTLTLSQNVPPPCNLTIPPQAVAEGELCGSNDNGGCDNAPDPPEFRSIQVGDVIHGSAWAAGGQRDTDWYELVLAETTDVILTVEAGFPFVMGLAETMPAGSGDCADFTGQISPSVVGSTCQQANVIATLDPGTWWPFVAPTAGDGLPCPAGVTPVNDYVLTVSLDASCLADCGDGDGLVDIEDFLAVLGQWGSAGVSCDMGLGEPGVGIDEFLHLLGTWGPCP